MDVMPYLVPPATAVRLKDCDPAGTGTLASKDEARKLLKAAKKEMTGLQDRLYAQNRFSLLIIFQAMDAAGKDSAIKHVMSGVNPQGCQVFSFKAPSAEELDHDYLWRCARSLPERGRIGVFNRSYYEEVLVVRVHPDFLDGQRLPPEPAGERLWDQRFDAINNFEQHLFHNGTIILKFFLHVSRKEQKKRFLKRIETPEKQWKFSVRDVHERGYWDAYMTAYEKMLNRTSTESAPWHIIPADHKWFTRLAVATIINQRLNMLNPLYPELSEEQMGELRTAKQLLVDEPD